MSCKHIEELLTPYLENELSSGERQDVEIHLDSCSECKDLLIQLQKLRDSLATFPELEISENLLGRLYKIPERKKKFMWSLDILLRPSFQPILAAATILLTLLSFYAFGPHRSSINKSIDQQIHLGYSKIEKFYTRAESFTHSVAGYKDNLLISLKNKNPLSRDEE